MLDLRKASRHERRAAAVYLERESAQWPMLLARLPPEQLSRLSLKVGQPPYEAWRNCDFLVAIYFVSEQIERLSINRTKVGRDGNWREDISWEELQDLKRQCGRGDFDAVEVFPADQDIVNVANMRHLWVLKVGHLDFAWRKS